MEPRPTPRSASGFSGGGGLQVHHRRCRPQAEFTSGRASVFELSAEISHFHPFSEPSQYTATQFFVIWRTVAKEVYVYLL
jgi:hypothetical protein